MRNRKQDAGLDQGSIETSDISSWFDLIGSGDRAKITRRASRYLDQLVSSTGMSHLSKEDKAALTPPSVAFGVEPLRFWVQRSDFVL